MVKGAKMSSFIDFRSLLPTKQASAWLYLKPGDRFIPDFPVHRRQSNQHSDLPQYVVTERKGLKSLVVSSPEGQLALNVQDVIFKSAYNLSPALLDARRKNTLRPSDPAPAWARDLDDELCRPIPNKAALTITRRIIRRYENRELGFHFNVWEGLSAVVPSIREFSVLGINQQRQIAKLAWDHLLGVPLIPMGHTDSFSYRERDANRLYWQNVTITQRTINDIEALQNEVKTRAGDHLFRQLTAFTSGALEAPFPSLLEFSSKWYVHFDSYDERSWSFPTMHHVRWAQIGYEASCRQLLSFWQCMANPALYEEHGATVLLEVCRRNKLGSERTSYLFKCIHGITFGRRRDAFVPTCEDVLYSRA